MSVIDIAKDISEGLARVACAGEVDGEVVDLRTVIDKDCELNILTFDSDEGKHAFRHTASHILAQAVKRYIQKQNLRSDLLSTMVSTMIWRKILHLHRKTLRRLKKK